MKIVTMTVSTKQNEVQILRWLVVQETPHPDISSNGGSRLQWRNDGGLFGHYGQPAEGIGERYDCYLLASDVADVPENYNRTHFAGYVAYSGDKTPKPGAMIVRGKSLGEMTIHFGANTQYQEIKVHGFDSPTHGEREVIRNLVVPKLVYFIQANKGELKDYAVKQIKERMQRVIAEVRTTVDSMESEISQAKF
jgi:hypothetical protein